MRLPLDAALDCGALDTASALGDVCAAAGGAELRCALNGPLNGPLLAALIVEGAALELGGGASVALEERLLDDGTVDLAGARVIAAPAGDAASAWAGGERTSDPGVALALRLSGGRIVDAAAVIAGVAAYPLRARQIEGALRGRAASAQLLEIAGETARIEAQPFGVGDVIDEAALECLAEAARAALRLALERAAA